MPVFAIAFFIVGLLLITIGIAVYKGKTGLIHYYHRKNVVDHTGYGKAIGRPIIIMGISGLISATMSFFGELWLTIGISVFFFGIILLLIFSVIAVKKYNGKIFDF